MFFRIGTESLRDRRAVKRDLRASLRLGTGIGEWHPADDVKSGEYAEA